MTQYFVPPAPVEDDNLDDVLQSMAAGITGLPKPMVRPRWQVNPPKQPEPSVNWCAIGVVSSTADTFAVIQHLSGTITESSGDLSQRHEQIEVLTSFYGPLAKSFASVLRDGLGIAQNLEALKAAGLYFVGAEYARAAPELVNQQWIRRWDLGLMFRRMVARSYPVANILSAEIDLIDDTGHVNEVIKVPPSGR